jgi:hypothetical protein
MVLYECVMTTKNTARKNLKLEPLQLPSIISHEASLGSLSERLQLFSN